MDLFPMANSLRALDPRAITYPDPLSMQVQDSALFLPIGTLSDHPKFWHLVLLVFEAVMEVVVVAFPGFIIARLGMFDSKTQKNIANINILLFTPCLIFSKLAAQLDGGMLKELAIIPVIFAAQTIISWGCAMITTYLFGLKTKPQKNFVVAMAVFGNSNSLPLSLVVSLSKTISGLHWDKMPGDNDNEVAARGILYLLIFSQLGQALRWSWGANNLLKPFSQYTPLQRGEAQAPLIGDDLVTPYKDSPENSPARSRASSVSGEGSSTGIDTSESSTPRKTLSSTEALDGTATENNDHEESAIHRLEAGLEHAGNDIKGWWLRLRRNTKRAASRTSTKISSVGSKIMSSLPLVMQKSLRTFGRVISRIVIGVISCLNVPLVSIIVSVVVAVVPALQAFFFTPGTFVNNSVTHAIQGMGNVAVPMILVVLGANLAPNTLPPQNASPEYKLVERKMLIASLGSRMVLATLFMAPLLAIMAKYIPISILDDPIFTIVCFLLAGAPSALQLAQICQVNEVFLGAVSQLLFYSYVVFILPSTIILVVLALEVVKWATQ